MKVNQDCPLVWGWTVEDLREPPMHPDEDGAEVEPEVQCDAGGKLRLRRPIDSRIKRPSADVGRDVLAQR